MLYQASAIHKHSRLLYRSSMHMHVPFVVKYRIRLFVPNWLKYKTRLIVPNCFRSVPRIRTSENLIMQLSILTYTELTVNASWPFMTDILYNLLDQQLIQCSAFHGRKNIVPQSTHI